MSETPFTWIATSSGAPRARVDADPVSDRAEEQRERPQLVGDHERSDRQLARTAGSDLAGVRSAQRERALDLVGVEGQ